MDASLWLVTEEQHCPLVRAAYLGIADTLRKFLCETYLSKLNEILMHDLQKPQKELQVHQKHIDTALFQKIEEKSLSLNNVDK